MNKATKVKLECGFVGYVLRSEFFLIGSEVEAFKRVSINPKDGIPYERITGKVAEILEE